MLVGLPHPVLETGALVTLDQEHLSVRLIDGKAAIVFDEVFVFVRNEPFAGLHLPVPIVGLHLP